MKVWKKRYLVDVFIYVNNKLTSNIFLKTFFRAMIKELFSNEKWENS